MSDAANQVSPNQAGRSAQIVVGGLMMGLAFFGAIAAYCVNGQPRQGMANGNGLIANIAVGFFVFAMAIGLVVSRMAVANSVRRITAENPENWRRDLGAVYLSKHLLSKAPLEAAGFFNWIAYMVDAQWINPAIVVAVLSLMAITFPSQSQFEAWAEQVQRDHS